jgi:hypothetical protein
LTRSSLTPERNVLLALAFNVRPHEALEFNALLAGPLTDSADRNRKAAVFAISWMNKDGRQIPGEQLGMSSSEKFGTFTYVPLLNPDEDNEFRILLVAPEKAAKLSVSLIRFSNFSMSLVESRIKRVNRQ